MYGEKHRWKIKNTKEKMPQCFSRKGGKILEDELKIEKKRAQEKKDYIKSNVKDARKYK